MKLAEIWKAIDEGKTVCWSNEGYEVHPVDSNESKYAKETERNNQALRCSFVDNYFGGYLSEKEFASCFVIDREPKIRGAK